MSTLSQHSTFTGQHQTGVFITFPGNCKKALTFYQSCFGGTLHFEFFDRELQGFSEIPVVSGSLVSDRIIIHGSDLVHNEGRKVGNYLSIFLPCESTNVRRTLIEKLGFADKDLYTGNTEEQRLAEVTDEFDVKWVLGVEW